MGVFRAYWRLLVVVRHFLPFLLTYVRDRRRFIVFGGRRRVSEARQQRRARRLLETLITLGPTFIKLGQLLSTRPDILPPAYVGTLSRLQDRVPPADWADAREVIETELGPVEERFERFDEEAISGASLGQVYRARVDDQDVAVKVRRPGVERLVEADLRVIRWTLPVLLYFVGDARAFSLSNLASEFERVIRQEMDYEREARMLDEIRGNFVGIAHVRMPSVIRSHSGQRVLTMEYVPGTKITDVAELDRRNIDRTVIARRLTRAYLKMVVEDGVYHADPHPGNLAIQDDGTIVFYDFGMSGRVDPAIQAEIVDFYIAVADRDIEAILDTLVQLGTLSPTADRALMAEVMELAIQDARGQQIEQYRVQQIVERVEDTLYEFPLRLPADMALMLRVATVVEGVCVTLDEDFDFIDVATTFLVEQGYHEESAREFVATSVTELRDAGRSLVRVPPKLDRLLDRADRNDLYIRAGVEDPQGRLDRLAKRLIMGMFLAAGVLSTAVLYAFSTVEASAAVGAVTLLVALLLVRSFWSGPRLGPQPQFTRQSLRQRRGGATVSEEAPPGLPAEEDVESTSESE